MDARAVSPSPLAAWRRLSPTARRLMAVRTLRSVGQGIFTVDFTLYLRALGLGAATIGALLAAEGLVGAGLMLLLGVLSDRYGRRRFLLVYQGLTVAGTALVLALPRPWTVAAAAVALGLGRGANGAAGPFGPVEQAWLAHAVPPPERGRAFSLNNGAAFAGMGAGALLAVALPLLRPLLPSGRAYLAMFALAGAIAVLNAAQLWPLPEPRPAPGPAGGAPAPSAHARAQGRALMRLVAVNAVNSLAIGVVGPLIPYWFAVRFGVGPTAIGPVYAVTYLATAAASLVAGEMAARLGLVRTVVITRVAGVALMAALPLAPGYGAAAAMYVARSMANRSSAGARVALGVGLADDRRRGLAASLNALSMRLPASVGPALGGWLFSLGDLGLPFFLAAALQLGFLALFATALRDVERLALEA
ncbi:MAG: MFS transporter [Firmicutes bacterium]|nr:MFS transporter [Bacillota bacterium]